MDLDSLISRLEVKINSNHTYSVYNTTNNKEVTIDELQLQEIANKGEIIDELMKLGFFKHAGKVPLFKKTENSFFDIRKIDGKRSGGVGLLGIPYDSSSTGITGVSGAPGKLRKISSGYDTYRTNIKLENETYSLLELEDKYEFIDCGDITYVPGEENKRLYNRITDAKEHLLKKHGIKTLIAIGGDHSCTIPLIKSIKYEDLIFIKFDAHFDNIKKRDFENVNHSNFVNEISELDNIKKVLHIGVRENLYNKNITEKDIYITPSKINEIDTVLKEIKKISNNIYISIDFDVLDPSIFKAASFLLPFGLSFQELTDLLFKLKDFNIVGIDLMEYNPLLDISNNDKYMCLNILKKCLDLIK